jgi:hypothetical protein
MKDPKEENLKALNHVLHTHRFGNDFIVLYMPRYCFITSDQLLIVIVISRFCTLRLLGLPALSQASDQHIENGEF